MVDNSKEFLMQRDLEEKRKMIDEDFYF